MKQQTDAKEYAKKMMDITTNCLRVVIDTALAEKYGEDWVSQYKKDFKLKAEELKAKEKRSIQQPQSSVKNIGQFDFLECLKVFRHMNEKYGRIILEKYNVNLKNEAAIMEICTNLSQFRNNYSHAKDEQYDLANDEACNQTMHQMQTLISYFPNVAAPGQSTFYDQLEAKWIEYKQNEKTECYCFSEFRGAQKFSNTILAQACDQLKIKTKRNADNSLYFYSNDVSSDLDKIFGISEKLMNETQKLPIGVISAVKGTSPQEPKSIVLFKKIIALFIIFCFGFVVFYSVKNSLFKDETTVPNTTSGQISAGIGFLSPGTSTFSEENTVTMTQSDKSAENIAAGVNQIPEKYKAIFDASNADWTERISVGETNLSPHAKSLVESDMYENIQCYSEDTSIATVGDNLIVTGQSKGTVRILYVYEFMDSERTYIIKYVVR